jgi:uncharacterized protein DUF559
MEPSPPSPNRRIQVQETAAFRRYIVDSICLEKRLIIEVDGGQHT